MSNQKNNSSNNNRHKGNRFLLKFVGISIIIVVIVLGVLRFWLIPQELQSYHPIDQKRRIAYAILQEQQIRNGKLLVQLTYLNVNGQWQIANDEQVGNAALFEVAYIELPGFGIPGEQSGIKWIGMDLQLINNDSMSQDPPVLSNHAVELNGGEDGFFSHAQIIPIPGVVATLHIFSTESIKGFGLHCYNIYVTPDLTFTAEPSTGPCISPFTKPLS